MQRAQAAVAGKQRRLVHIDESVRKEVMMEIQQKKEELYDVLSKAEKDYFITNWSNRRLLQNLSVQVAPRPYDRKWIRLRIVKKVNNFVETAGLVSLSGVMGVGLVFLDWPPAKKKAPLASKSSAENFRAENL
ncbi:unnamed protein product [Alopecurus aequalis]